MAEETKGIVGAMPAIGIGMDIANTALGWFGGNDRQKKQYYYQRKLNEQMAQIQRDNWDYTNAENQRKHYEKAGLNVGLMYGSNGAGGATMGGGSGGSVGMAETPKFMGMGIQGVMAESQIELNKAQADKLKADADKTRGVDTDLVSSQIANLNANTGNTEADTIIKNLQATGLEIDNYIKNSSAEFEIDKAEYLSGKLNEELKNLEITNYKDRATAETAIKQTKANLASTYLQQEATRVGIKLTKEQTRAISVELAQGWEELSLKHDSNVNQMNANQIKLLETKIYKALGEEGNELIRRGQNLQLMQNVGNVLKGNTTRDKK